MFQLHVIMLLGAQYPSISPVCCCAAPLWGVSCARSPLRGLENRLGYQGHKHGGVSTSETRLEQTRIHAQGHYGM